MKDKPICAIVAEYNPFHNGHLNQIKKTKEIIGDAYIVAIMSGNFTQRGLPAIADKFSRAKAAVSAGVDMVIELPAIFATQSADIFAGGAIKIIKSMGIFDYISFGAESDNIEELKEAAEFFASPSAESETVLRNCLSEGDSFPRARARAYTSVTGNDGDFLSHSNNILALEYLKHISLVDLDIKSIAIERKGPDFNDEDLNLNVSSATSIRKYIRAKLASNWDKQLIRNVDGNSEYGIGIIIKEDHKRKSSNDREVITKKDYKGKSSNNHDIISKEYSEIISRDDSKIILRDDILKTTMPKTSLEEILNSIEMMGDLNLENNLLEMVRYKMITDEDLHEKVFDLNQDTFNYIKSINSYDYREFVDIANTKNITVARVQRILNNIFLEITPNLVYDSKIIKNIRYINILGISKNSIELLSTVAKAAKERDIKVITKANDIKELLADKGEMENNAMSLGMKNSIELEKRTSLKILELDLKASLLYELISKLENRNMDYYTKRIIT